jgi:hypothetical protein
VFDGVKVIYPQFSLEAHTFLAHFLVNQIVKVREAVAIVNTIPFDEDLHAVYVEKVIEHMKIIDVIFGGHLTNESFMF